MQVQMQEHLVVDISIHALREEGDKKPLDYGILGVTFLSTPSARRATGYRGPKTEDEYISIHALREEGDRGDPSPHRQGAEHFYPRPPRGGRRVPTAAQTLPSGYFYPRPPRGGRPKTGDIKVFDWEISIHALREEGDGIPTKVCKDANTISIHALREEGDKTIRQRQKALPISIHALREEGDPRSMG